MSAVDEDKRNAAIEDEEKHKRDQHDDEQPESSKANSQKHCQVFKQSFSVI